MRSASSIKTDRSVRAALRDALTESVDRLGSEPQCVITFIAHNPADEEADAFLRVLKDHCPHATIYGAITDGVVGVGREVESPPAVSVLVLGEMSRNPIAFEMETVKTHDGWSILGLVDEWIDQSEACNGLLVSACPSTFFAEKMFRSIESFGPSVRNLPVYGGHVSRTRSEHPCTFFCNNRVVRRGAIGLVMPPDIRWEPIISHGCRPIGEPMVITDVEDQTITGLGGKPALLQLRSMFDRLPNREKAMAMELLLLGRAVSEYSEKFSHGEFLIRNITSIDQGSNGILVSDRFRVGQTVRFHILDAEAADADLNQQLSQFAVMELNPSAGLLFTCNGRGSQLFDHNNHDAAAIQRYFPETALSGHFSAGEFGPIHRQNLVNSFCAVAAFLVEANRRHGEQSS